jgi:hypothetical protein
VLRSHALLVVETAGSGYNRSMTTKTDSPDLPIDTDHDEGRAPVEADKAPGHGAYAPGLAARIGLSLGRRLPAGRTGLRAAGAVRPLALLGLT